MRLRNWMLALAAVTIVVPLLWWAVIETYPPYEMADQDPSFYAYLGLWSLTTNGGAWPWATYVVALLVGWVTYLIAFFAKLSKEHSRRDMAEKKTAALSEGDAAHQSLLP